ncbi:MAG TPA: VCBS repeat-containing protein, partial [Planctomycetota bacterium]|nr:VCBS repeat-containing protein [Planctomycetota bacterium]
QASNSGGQIYSEPRMMPLAGGVFGAPFVLPAPSLPFWAQTYRTVAGDFDGDGLPDLAYAASGHVLRNTGGFSFVAIETLRPAPTIANPVTSQAVPSLATLDVDVDGQDELAYSFIAHNAATASTELRRYAGGSPAGGFRISEMYEGSLLAFDADGDGDRDLATTAARRLTVHLNDGAGGLVAAGPTLAPSNLSLRRHFGDVDADGDLDVLAVPETWAGSFFLFIGVNDGYGAFTWTRAACPGLAQGSSGSAYGDSAVFDHGGDGDADLYVGGFHPPGQASRDIVLVNGARPDGARSRS